MSLINDIAELRNAVSQPDDLLFAQLSDLIVALNEASDVKNGRDVLILKSKRKKNKKSREFVEKSGSNVGGSESNVEDVTRQPWGISSKFSIIPKLTDSDIELSAALPPSGKFLRPSDIARNVDLQKTWRVATVNQLDDTQILKLKIFRSPLSRIEAIESDSFTETCTPAKRYRKKKLIKKMAVDQCIDSHVPSCSYSSQTANRTFPRELCLKDLKVIPQYLKQRTDFYGSKQYMDHLSSCHPENSMDCEFCYAESSESDDDASSDGGHQGDDEHSDWYFEVPSQSKDNDEGYDESNEQPDEFVMGVPDIKTFFMRKVNRDRTNAELSRYVQIIESSDTDISQSSNSLRCSTRMFAKRLLAKNVPSMTSALNRRILAFLNNRISMELPLGVLKKRERKEALRLASFYNLDVSCKMTKSIQSYTLVKTKYTLKT